MVNLEPAPDVRPPFSHPPAVLFALFAFVNTSLRRVFSPKDGLADSISLPDGSSSDGIERDHAFAAMMLFGAAFMFNMNAAMWSLHVTKTSLNLQVAYISAVAAWTHYEMWLGKDWYVSYMGSRFMGGNAVAFSGLRQLEWCFTTPILLTIVQNIHAYAFAAAGTSDKGKRNPATYQPVNRAVLIAADECMLLCGLVLPLASGVERAVFLTAAVACFVFIIYHSVHALLDVMTFSELSHMDSARLTAIVALKVIAWSGYPITYFATEFGYIDCKTQHDWYLYNDVITKFSYTLIISAGSLRFIEVLEERRKAFAIQMSRVQRAFFFNITHELRTPLNSIIGFNTLAMESGELTEFTESFIKASLTSAEALLGLINQILDFAKFEGAKDKSGGSNATIELSDDVFTLRQLVEQVMDISQKASSRGVDLIFSITSPEHFNTKLVGDFFRLRQCCVNLVDNAIKYSSNVDGRTALVEFSMGIAQGAKPDSLAITFAVEDNGVGIKLEKQHTLFVPFCQPADHKTAKEKGTGLGLVITKAIIDCMGGEIDFESVEATGTKFFFTLDFARAREASVDGGDDADFVEDSAQLEALPPKARVVFHPAMNESTRKHVTCVMKCFGAKPGVNYVTVPGEDKLKDKIRQASLLGVPVVLTDVINLNSSLDFIKATPRAGIIIFGLPYQLMELHKNISDMRNIQTVLKPVKPSDLLKAIAKLTHQGATGEIDFLNDTNDSEDGAVQKRLEHAEIKAAENALIKAEPPDVAEGAGELKGMTVLLVEDNIMNQQMAKFSILKCGADLEIAMHGQEAVDIVTARFDQGKPGYDCILMDMMMPIMDGATASTEIRALEQRRRLTPQTIVGLSANVGPEYTARVKAAGMDGSMSKPFYPATLRNTLLNVKKGTYVGFGSSRLSIDRIHTTIEEKPGN